MVALFSVALAGVALEKLTLDALPLLGNILHPASCDGTAHDEAT